jgi:ATP-dependent Clp protease adaptor protein ClpS
MTPGSRRRVHTRQALPGECRPDRLLHRKLESVGGVVARREPPLATRPAMQVAAGPVETPSRTGSAPAAPERSIEHDFDRDVLRRLLPPYKVVVHNNDYNTFEEVIRILLKAVPGMTYERAVELTFEIDRTGAAVPYVGPKERAEAIADVIRTIGIKVTVEPDE